MENSFNMTDYVTQTAALINLNIAPEYLPGVVDNLTRIAAIATLVTEFELTEDLESAATFDPVESNK